MQRSGFTLIELSIVLVIIGLVAGGVFVGQSMIKQATMREVISDFDAYETAVLTYKLKYSALPGDHVNAYAYWPGATGCSTNAVVTGTAPAGCNGDGDNIIEHNISEHFKAWTHMSLAGLLDGQYNGTFTTNMDYQKGVNLPIAGENGLFLLYQYHLGSRQYASGTNWNQLKHRMYVDPNTGLTVTMIAGLDMKRDDGKAGTGKLTVHSNSCTDQGVGGNADAAEFLTTNPNLLCSLDWVINL
jgi:prepilin-type N-terminal cleavage/methylation domain-containing protein